MDNKPSELAVRIAEDVFGDLSAYGGDDPVGYITPGIAEHIAPLEAQLSGLQRDFQSLTETCGQYAIDLAASQAECERLKSLDWETMAIALTEAAEERDALRQQVEGLRKDAERYRLIRQEELPEGCDLAIQRDRGEWFIKSGKELDDTLDAGLKIIREREASELAMSAPSNA